MEPTRYIITILIITNANAISLGNATVDISGLNKFNEMIDKLIAETESSVTVPIESKIANETSKDERTSKQGDKGQGIVLPNEKYTDSILHNKQHEELSSDKNRDAQINNLNVKRNNSKIIYINKTLPHNLSSAEKMDIIEKTSDFPEFLQTRRSFNENDNYEEFFKKMFDNKPPGVDHGRGIVVKEEFSFEIEDDKPIHEPIASENMVNNDTFHKMITPPAEPLHDGGGHFSSIPFDLPPTPTPTHNEATDLRTSNQIAGEKLIVPISYHQDHSNELLTELSKINTKIKGVEDLLKKSIVKGNDVNNYRQLVQNPELVKPERNVGLARPKNLQSVVPYQHTIYQAPLQNSFPASSVLSLQERLIEERARNYFLNLKLEKLARARQNFALLNELIRARSRLTLRLPTVFRRILL